MAKPIKKAIGKFASGILEWSGIKDKKGFDYLQLILTAFIPVFIFVATQEINKKQQEINAEHHQQETITKYHDFMSPLLLNNDLQDVESKARPIARARTLSSLRELDDVRKGSLVKFLADAELLTIGNSPVMLVGADLQESNFINANLSSSDLSGTDLTKADFREANLTDINFYKSNLNNANLGNSYLVDAYLRRADLSSANFLNSDLKDTNLKEANLTNTNLSNTKNLTNQQIKSACYWEEAIYTEAEWNEEEDKWVAVDVNANDEMIRNLRNHQDSDKFKSSNCDTQWK